MNTTATLPSPATAASVLNVTEIVSGTLLAIGDCNHDYVFVRSDFGGVVSTRVEAKGKPGQGVDCQFGSPRYFAEYARNKPSNVSLTPAGVALVAASYAQLKAIGGVWC